MNHLPIEIFERYITEAKNLPPDERGNFLAVLIQNENGHDYDSNKLLWEEVSQLIDIYRRGVVDGMEEFKTSVKNMKSPFAPPPAPDRK